jgi:hypothetical protein
MMVSPRKRPRSSIVAGFRVATTDNEIVYWSRRKLLLTRVVIVSGFVYDEAIWAATSSVGEIRRLRRTHDFFGLRMAVETSSGPGWGGAPLGSAIEMVVEDELARCREREGHASSYRTQTQPNTTCFSTTFETISRRRSNVFCTL